MNANIKAKPFDYSYLQSIPDEGPSHPDDGFQPKSRMHHVEGLQAFAQPSVQQLVAPFQPGKLGRIAATGSAVQVDEHIVVSYQLVKGFDDISKRDNLNY